MSYFYGLLAVTGWVWLALVGVFLFAKLRRRADAPHGFDVDVRVAETTDAKQH